MNQFPPKKKTESLNRREEKGGFVIRPDPHLRDSSGGLGQLCGDSLLPQGSAEKCVRQVAHQMMHLRNVWGGGVLPESIYKRELSSTPSLKS